MKTETTRSERQAAKCAGVTSRPNGLPMAACLPITPGVTIEATLAHAKRLAAVSRAAAARGVKPGNDFALDDIALAAFSGKHQDELGGPGLVVVVPEATTFIAGALLLLPFSSCAVRYFRGRRQVA